MISQIRWHKIEKCFLRHKLKITFNPSRFQSIKTQNWKMLSITQNWKMLSITQNWKMLSITQNWKMLSITQNWKMLSITQNWKILLMTDMNNMLIIMLYFEWNVYSYFCQKVRFWSDFDWNLKNKWSLKYKIIKKIWNYNVLP